MRENGDPLADEVIQRLVREGEVRAVNRLMRHLVENADLVPEGLPPFVQEYLREVSAPVSGLDAARVRRAVRLFERCGPEVLLSLGFYSLPAAYAARKGVQVLARTGRLAMDSARRVSETAQFVVDVMERGGLGPQGRGIRSAQKVRLMHASVRGLLLQQRDPPWDRADLGLPLNQEDLAGTLLTFSIVVLQGLDALGVPVTSEEKEDWLHCWVGVGRMLGVDERILPADVTDAVLLMNRIRVRHIAASLEGQEMTAALLKGIRSQLPWFLGGLPATLIHFFLDNDRYNGQDVPAMLGVPSPDWTGRLAPLLVRSSRLINRLQNDSRAVDLVTRWCGMRVVEAMLQGDRGGTRPPFQIPTDLYTRWSAGLPALSLV
jgi:aromatic ring-cleaving dioxygenase